MMLGRYQYSDMKNKQLIINNQEKEQACRQRGFTLIEIMTALSIFIIVMK